MPDLSQLTEAIKSGDAKNAEAITREAVAAGVNPSELVSGYMIPAMDEIGARFECQQAYVPELIVAARAMKAAMAVVDPLIKQAGGDTRGRIIIGTVEGDLHDIGKNLVASMLNGGGFETIDLGANVSPQRFVEAVREHQAHAIALSALLTTTMPAMKKTIDAFVDAGMREQVRVFIGGAPITQSFAEEIGADGYGETANGAVKLARQYLAAGPATAG